MSLPNKLYPNPFKLFYKWLKKNPITLFFLGLIGGSIGLLADLTSLNQKDPKVIVVEKEVCDENSMMSGTLFPNQIDPYQETLITIANSDKGPFSIKMANLYDGKLRCLMGKLIQPGYPCNFSFRYTLDGLMINVKIYDHQNSPVGIIEKNNFIVNDECRFMVNYDERAFEIVNNTLDVIFSLEIVEKNRIEIKGLLKLDERDLVFTGSQRMFVADKNRSSDKINELSQVPRIFKYPSDKHRGERLYPRIENQLF